MKSSIKNIPSISEIDEKLVKQGLDKAMLRELAMDGLYQNISRVLCAEHRVSAKELLDKVNTYKLGEVPKNAMYKRVYQNILADRGLEEYEVNESMRDHMNEIYDKDQLTTTRGELAYHFRISC